jgi:hypothetical protein
LTLQSVRGEDDVETLGGPSAGVAGDLSAIDLARGVGHILSRFSLTLELDVNLSIEQIGGGPIDSLIEELAYADVRRAGLAFRGLKYTYPRDAGPRPLVFFERCQGVAPGALCGGVTWEGVVEAKFQAGPGLFSCIDN